MEAFQGWAPDPFALHEARYFSNGRPTSLVRDGDVQSYDAPPAHAASPALPTPEPGAPGSYWAPPLVPPTAVPTPPSIGAHPPGGDTAAPRGTAFDTSGSFAVAAPVAPSRGSRRGSRRPLAAVLAAIVVVLAAVGASIGLVGGSKSAEAEVIDSVNATMADQTAHLTMSLSGGVGNVSIDGTGSGVIDFSQNAASLQATLNADGQQVELQEVYLGGVFYEGLPGIDQLVPGKSWVSVDLSSLQQGGTQNPAQAEAMNNPAVMLRVLAQQGNTVAALGPSIVDGTSVQGYSVTVNAAALKSRLGRLPSWMQQALSRVNMRDIGMKVFVDGSGLLRRMTVHMAIATGSSPPVSVDASIDYSDFGSPVTVSSPPADQVVSLQQFLQAAAAAVSASG